MAQEPIKVSFAQLAHFTLSVVDKAVVPADEQTLAILGAARQFLRGVVSGEFVVSNAVKATDYNEDEYEDELPPVLTRNQRRAKGIEGVQPAQKPKKGGINGDDGVVSDKITGAPGR